MEESNEIVKIIPQAPKSIDVPEATLEQQTSAENPFAFEKECIAKLDGYLKEQFPKTYFEIWDKEENKKSALSQKKTWLKGLREANIPLTKTEKYQEALVDYAASGSMEPIEFSVIDEDGKEEKHTACKRKYFYYEQGDIHDIEVYVDLPSEYAGDFRNSNDSSDKYQLNMFAGRGYSMHSKKRAKELFSLCAYLGEKETPLPETIVERCREKLRGKRILILGDDTGSLSEVLKSFGADCVGIEYDKTQVKVAHTGVFSEDGKPNMDVIQGDIWDLALDDTELIKKLGSKKFDGIISVAMFNSGSGATKPTHISEGMDAEIKKLSTRSTLTKESGEDEWFGFYLLRMQRLLKDNGIQIHQRTDVPYNMTAAIKHSHQTTDQWGPGEIDGLLKNMVATGKIELGSDSRELIVKK